MELEFKFDIAPIELNSERAKQVKVSYRKYQNPLKPSKPEPTIDPLPKQRVLAALETVEAGQPQLWWQIVLEMTLIPTSEAYIHNHVFESDITRLPGWKEAEANTKVRIVETAKRYLDAGDPETQTWLGTNKFSHPPFAGYQALYLLAKQEPDFISTISTDTWTKWIPVILKSINFTHGNTKSKEDNVCREIVRAAHQSAPDELIKALISLMVRNHYQPHTFYPDDVYRLTNELLDQCLSSLIIGRVPDENLNAGMLEILLTDLFNHDIDKAKEIAKSFLPAKVPESGGVRNKAIVAACLLANYPDNSSWSVFWSAVQQDHEFGREVLESVAFQAARQGQIEQKIKEDYLADLYIFLTQQYPEIEQPELETQELRGIEAQILREFDGVRMWKNYIPRRLQARGTPEACDALRKIICELPEQKEQLQPTLLETESLARRNTWKPPKPEEILQLVANQEPSMTNSFKRNEQLMTEQSHPNFSGATFNAPINFAPNYGNQAQNLNIQDTEQNFEVALTDFKQFVTDLQTQYPNVNTPEAATQTITVQAKHLPQPRLQNFLNLKRLWNGSKKAGLKVGEHFAESNVWGKGAIAFLEGVSEDM
ncbi:MAG: hypothetical protein HC799_19475 [Limnothrix sp. RL_2_0]|nr:hypothetical protein [Limnothrix sp. RL_2_0]